MKSPDTSILPLLPLSLLFVASIAIAAPDPKSKAGPGEQAQPMEPSERVEQQRERQRVERQTERQTEWHEQVREEARPASADERAAEMKARNEEKQRIKEEYRASGEKQKGKKPWWKFWESNEDTSTGPDGD